MVRHMARTGKIEGWIKNLDDDRLEIFLKAEGVLGIEDRKVRASGKRDEMYELVDWFEAKTGLTVNVPQRLRTGPPPLAGQMDMLQLSSEETSHA